MMDIFRPELHPHELERKIHNELYTCDGCKEYGFGLSFRCEQCNFMNLHEQCAHTHVKKNTSHDLYKNNIFKFLPKPPDDRSKFCAGCGDYCEGFVYYCEELNTCLHPCCLRLPSKFKFDHVEFRLRYKMASVCLWCNKSRLQDTDYGIQGWSYVSKCNKYNFHVRCVTGKMLLLRLYDKGFRLGNSLPQSLHGFLEISIGGFLKRQRRRKVVISFIITNLVFELVSAVLDQVSSSVNKTQCALFGMLISFAAMLTCIVELIYEVRTEKLIWRWSSTLPFPWYYYRDQGRKPFGTFKDIVGLICALCQCVVAMVSYCYLRRHADNPIKISFFPIIFAFGILFSGILKNQDAKKPSRFHETPALPNIVIEETSALTDIVIED